ncbi:Gfo/Idh/MocA family oxidoreductase [Roseibium sp. RKSG952]|nr:Gfo/Idh/MocA family oxidoreductase [Roseibium sp. RKSG952]
MKRFCLIGAAGYIAPRHMGAIRETGHDLVLCYDKSDSIGVIDSYFPQAAFVTDMEELNSEVTARQAAGKGIDVFSIASPNQFHKDHIIYALHAGGDVICEKPLVIDPADLDHLSSVEQKFEKSISTILQLRLHPAILQLKREVCIAGDRKHEVDLTYITSRGSWYHKSWKGDERKSGGIATNIGVHFFDMLHFLFGELLEYRVHLRSPLRSAGYLEYERARVRWYLSIDNCDIQRAGQESEKRTYRSITIDGKEVEFSGGFTDLHVRSYEEALAGRGFSVEDNRVAIETVAAIRTAALAARDSVTHPIVDAALREGA